VIGVDDLVCHRVYEDGPGGISSSLRPLVRLVGDGDTATHGTNRRLIPLHDLNIVRQNRRKVITLHHSYLGIR